MASIDPLAGVAERARRRAARRTAWIAAGIAVLVYVGFMSMAIYKAG